MSNYVRNYWFQTDDTRYIVCVTQFEDSEPVVVDLDDDDQVADYEPPACTRVQPRVHAG